MSVKSFAELGVSPPLLDVLSARGIAAPFPVQAAVLPDALAGHDVLVRSPTGSGKTLVFAIAAVQRATTKRSGARVLVLAPTRELAGQIVEETRPLASARNLSVAAVYGGVGFDRQQRQAARAHVIVATPGRLLDLIERGAVKLGEVEVLVLDEADRMLDMGFRPAVERIVRMTPASRQTLLLSATLEGEVGRLAAGYTRSPRRHELEQHPSGPVDIEHHFVPVELASKLPALVSLLQESPGSPTLVFVRTKRGAERLVKQLRAHGIASLAMHGNKSQGQRERALARFRSGEIDTLVATDVAARGIDVDTIEHVINYDAPPEREDYVHRVGRTGRAGRSGRGTTLVLQDQRRAMARIAGELELGEHAALPTAARHGHGGGERPANGQRPANAQHPGNGPRRRRRRSNRAPAGRGS